MYFIKKEYGMKKIYFIILFSASLQARTTAETRPTITAADPEKMTYLIIENDSAFPLTIGLGSRRVPVPRRSRKTVATYTKTFDIMHHNKTVRSSIPANPNYIYNIGYPLNASVLYVSTDNNTPKMTVKNASKRILYIGLDNGNPLASIGKRERVSPGGAVSFNVSKYKGSFGIYNSQDDRSKPLILTPIRTGVTYNVKLNTVERSWNITATQKSSSGKPARIQPAPAGIQPARARR